MKNILADGYLWKFYGFTRLHIWGLHIVVGYLLCGTGVGLLGFAAVASPFLSETIFWRLVGVSSALFLAAIATILGSIFTLLFYSGAAKLKLLSVPDSTDKQQNEN